MLPEDVIAELPGVARIEGIERIKHGLTNESWLVRTDADAFVVRMSNTAEDSLQINRASEARILETVAWAGIGPEIILCDPARHLLVTRYMGPTWSDDDAIHPENMVSLAELLGRLHILVPPSGLHKVDLASVIDGYLHTLDASGAHGSIGPAALRVRAREVAHALQRDSIPCLCHNDIHALNVVATASAGLRLIDWEYAGLGERMFDLASLCIYHRYDKAQREQLLSAYVPADSAALHRLELACWLFDYIRDLWTAVRAL